MAFPYLFPYGTGCPFEINAKRKSESLIEIVRHLINYCEEINGVREYRFAKHSRFILWIYNIIY